MKIRLTLLVVVIGATFINAIGNCFVFRQQLAIRQRQKEVENAHAELADAQKRLIEADARLREEAKKSILLAGKLGFVYASIGRTTNELSTQLGDLTRPFAQ
jgi:hypothetical protein